VGVFMMFVSASCNVRATWNRSDNNIMNTPTLFTPVRLGAVEAPNRLVMAPLTRMRAGQGRVPTPLMAEYYSQRASAGLIVTEATAVSQQGTGCPNTPGIYTDEQVAAGEKSLRPRITPAAAFFFSSGTWAGSLTELPAGRRVAGRAQRYRPAVRPGSHGDRNAAYVTPRALEITELRASWRSIPPELNGPKSPASTAWKFTMQRLSAGSVPPRCTNRRTDDYGGPVGNRARLTLEVAEAVTKVWGADRVGIRFSPGGVFNDMHDSNPLATFSYVLHELNRFHLAYAHLIVSRKTYAARRGSPVPLAALRKEFHGPLIVANGFNRETATRAVAEGAADAVAFGRLFLPTRPSRAISVERATHSPDESTFYSGAEKGYTDYPALVRQLV